MFFPSRKIACVRGARAALAAALTIFLVVMPRSVDFGRASSTAPRSTLEGSATRSARSAGTVERATPAAAEMARIYSAISSCAPRMAERERRTIAATIISESLRHGYDPLFVQAIVEVESTCRPAVRSHAGAIGLIQIKPATARSVAQRYGIRWRGASMLLDPGVNVQLGLQYLAELEERFQDPYLAVAAYNLGPTRVARMAPTRARRSRYVREVFRRYEGLLSEYGTLGL